MGYNDLGYQIHFKLDDGTSHEEVIYARSRSDATRLLKAKYAGRLQYVSESGREYPSQAHIESNQKNDSEKSSNAIPYLLGGAIALFLIYQAFVLVGNIISIGTIIKYDTGLYWSNIKNFENNNGRLRIVNLYDSKDKTMPFEVTYPESKINIKTIQGVVIYQGYKSDIENERYLIAVSSYIDDETVYGYIPTVWKSEFDINKIVLPIDYKQLKELSVKLIQQKIQAKQIRIVNTYNVDRQDIYDKKGYYEIEELEESNSDGKKIKKYYCEDKDKGAVKEILDDVNSEKSQLFLANKIYGNK